MKKIGGFISNKIKPEMKCAKCNRLGIELVKSMIPLLTYKGEIVCQECVNRLRKEERETQEKEREKQQ